MGRGMIYLIEEIIPNQQEQSFFIQMKATKVTNSISNAPENNFPNDTTYNMYIDQHTEMQIANEDNTMVTWTHCAGSEYCTWPDKLPFLTRHKIAAQ